jgi:hypothetical protein
VGDTAFYGERETKITVLKVFRQCSFILMVKMHCGESKALEVKK